MPVWVDAASDVVVAMQRKRIRRLRRWDGIEVDNQDVAAEILAQETELLEMRHPRFFLERKHRAGLHMQMQAVPVAVILPRLNAVLGPQTSACTRRRWPRCKSCSWFSRSSFGQPPPPANVAHDNRSCAVLDATSSPPAPTRIMPEIPQCRRREIIARFFADNDCARRRFVLSSRRSCFSSAVATQVPSPPAMPMPAATGYRLIHPAKLHRT